MMRKRGEKCEGGSCAEAISAHLLPLDRTLKIELRESRVFVGKGVWDDEHWQGFQKWTAKPFTL